MNESFPAHPDDKAQHSRHERAQELLKRWFESTPVYLASSSAVRREGLIKIGFNAENVTTIPAPDSAEAAVFRMSTADTMLMDSCAKAKMESVDSVADDAFVFSFDTLVGIYPDMIDPAHPETLGIVMGETVRKPESDEAAKEAAKKVFLTVMLNYARFATYERQAACGKTAIEDVEAFERARVAATGIHAITGMQVRFPGSDETEAYRDRIIALPRRLYSILEAANGDSFADPIDTTETLASMPFRDGGTIGDVVSGIVDEVMETMESEGVDPVRISGGVAYSLDSVRKCLGIDEVADLFQDGIKSNVPDQSIYSGYPEHMVGNALRVRAESLS
ncbi:MAG TPA: hypothetical protein VN420_02585 [Candidatus Fimivivens sp.]|nr:hypothetical protein [Candidatus Fimivivens sp.]